MPNNRIPKSKRRGWKEDEPAPPSPTLAMELFQSVRPLIELPRTEEEKREVYLTIIRLRMHGKTQKEIADMLHISERTVRNYMSDELYGQVQFDMEAEAKQNAHLLVADLTYKAISTLERLMTDAKSEYVQFSAAWRLGEWLGLAIPKDDPESSDKKALAEFLMEVDKRQPRIQVNVQVNSDGKPTGDVTQVVESDVAELPSSTSYSDIPEELLRYYQPVQPGGKVPEMFQIAQQITLNDVKEEKA